MDIQVNKQTAGTTILIESKTISTGNLREFRDLVLPELADANKVYLDLQQVTFIDSAGLGALISCLRVCSQNGADLVLTGLSKNVKTLFNLMKVERLFTIEDKQAAA